MALSDAVVIAYSPFNYTPASSSLKDHLGGVDVAIGTVAPQAGRPGDEFISSPTAAEMIAQGLDTGCIAYWSLDFRTQSNIPDADSDYEVVASTTANTYVPFMVLNSNKSLSSPLGAAYAGDDQTLFTNAHISALALAGSMTYLGFYDKWLDINTSDQYFVSYGNLSVGTDTTNANRLGYTYYMGKYITSVSTTSRDRALSYAHRDSGDVLVIAQPVQSPTQQAATGMGVSVPSMQEMMHGFTRTVGATTDIEFFINALSVGSATGLANPGTPGTDANMRTHLGYLHNAAGSMSGGSVRCAAIWDRVLTDEEILKYYNLCIGKL